MNARYPALIRSALPPRHRRSRPAVVAAECQFFVPEFSAVEMPEVLRCTAPMGWGEVDTISYRYFDGGLYSRHPRSLDDFLEDIGNPFRTAGAFRKLLDEIGRHIRMLDRRSVCWPPGIDRALAQGFRPDVLDRAFANSGLVTFDRSHRVHAEEYAYDLANWRDRWMEQASLFAIVDGSVWRRAPEPLIRVELDFTPGRISLVTEDAFATVRGLDPENRLTKDFHFPVTGLREAVSFAAANLPDGARVHGHEEIAIELESPRYLRNDVYSMDIRNEARKLLRDLFKYRSVEDEVALDTAMSSLEKALGPDQDFCSSDVVAKAVEALLDAAEMINAVTGIVPGRKIRSSCYRLHVDKWFDRPVRDTADGVESVSPLSGDLFSFASGSSASDNRTDNTEERGRTWTI